MKRKLLGYGIFCGVYWGETSMKRWQFESIVGICKTKEECFKLDRRILHCLSRETRRIYNTTKLNIGHHCHPSWVTAEDWLKHYDNKTNTYWASAEA